MKVIRTIKTASVFMLLTTALCLATTTANGIPLTPLKLPGKPSMVEAPKESENVTSQEEFRVYGKFDETMLRAFNKWYNALPPSTPEIHLRINSPGGSIMVLSEMLARIADFKLKGKVITYNDAMAASAGFALFIHGDERVGYNSSVFMHHEPAGSVQGKTHELESRVELFKLFEAMMLKRLGAVGVPSGVLKEKFTLLRDKWFSSEELLNIKVVTKIIE